MYWKMSRWAVVLGIVCALSSAMHAEAAKSCSNADMEGAYGFIFRGTNLSMKVDFIIVGRLEADGKGAFKGTESETVNGNVAHGPFTGTYTVHSDCTGSAKLTFEKSRLEATLDIVLVANGNEVFMIDIGGNLESGEAKRQFWKTPKR